MEEEEEKPKSKKQSSSSSSSKNSSKAASLKQPAASDVESKNDYTSVEEEKQNAIADEFDAIEDELEKQL